jgi:hypothetical protein
MTDPRRLLASDATEFERLLLGAAGREQPSPFQRKRMRRALVLAEFGILTTSVKAIASLASHVVVVAVVASTLAGGTSSSQVAPANDARASVASTIAGTAGPTQEESSPVAPSAILPYDATAEHLPLVGDSPSDVKASGRTRRLPALHEEIVLMDQARTALRSGAPSKALTILGRYQTQFPRGSFGQEVTVLRIEALAASGSRSSAVAEAKNFLATHPNSPHAERLRLVTGKSSPR